MPFLDAALAFALTIFVVAIAVTQINNLILKFFKVSLMQNMLKEFFADELEPVVKRELSRLKTKVKEDVSKKFSGLANSLTENEVFAEKELAENIDVSTEELLERIKRSELGDELLQKFGDEAKSIFNELGKRYEILGNKFTVSFRKHSRKWATGVAIVLALVLNIDCVFIANTYIKNESVREGVLIQMNDIVSDYETKVATISNDTDTVLVSDIKNAIQENKEQINILTNTGFPIGFSYFPHVDILKNCFNRKGLTELDDRTTESKKDWFLWAIGILLTGFLAGLGAPFWYDAINGINRFAQKTRSSKTPKTDS